MSLRYIHMPSKRQRIYELYEDFLWVKSGDNCSAETALLRTTAVQCIHSDNAQCEQFINVRVGSSFVAISDDLRLT